MGLGAIVVVGTELKAFSSSQENKQDAFLAEPLACIEILGRTMLERTVGRFARAGVDVISVLVPEELSHALPAFSDTLENLEVEVTTDTYSAVRERIREFWHNGIEHTFVASVDTYTETDLLDLFYFHREARQAGTRAFDSESPLDLWVVDCARAQEANLESLLKDCAGPSYFVREYVSRLTHARDLRRLVSDVLRGRCRIRPSGTELKPGIWVGGGAEIHRRARIVAPAYVGRHSEIREDTLITRFSSIEKNSFVDYGTVVEDSSILANTHVGIWLDVCHSVASESKLFNLERNVILEISDPSIMRAAVAARSSRNLFGVSHAQPVVADLRHHQQEKTPAPEPWQLGANPIQG